MRRDTTPDASRDRRAPARDLPARPDRHHRRDERHAPARRLLDQHQDPARLLVRALRRPGADRRPVVRPADPPRHARPLRARRSSSGTGPTGSSRATPSSATTAISAASTSTTSAWSRRSSLDGRPFAYAVAMAHHVDVGGGTPGSIGLHREQIQEGLDHPAGPDHARRRRRRRRPRRCSSPTSASPRETEGDLRAQLAAVTVGLRRLAEIVERARSARPSTRRSTTSSPTPDGGRSRRSRALAARARSRRPTISTTTASPDDAGQDRRRGSPSPTTRSPSTSPAPTDQRPSSINTTKGGDAVGLRLRAPLPTSTPTSR